MRNARATLRYDRRSPSYRSLSEPMDRLIFSFWWLVIFDLSRGKPAAELWLESDDFGWWTWMTMGRPPEEVAPSLTMLAARYRPADKTPAIAS